MKTPASIIAGAIVPLGLVNPLPFKPDGDKKETKTEKAMRKMYIIVAALSLMSELIAVIWYGSLGYMFDQ
jgi:hypothetical protein